MPTLDTLVRAAAKCRVGLAMIVACAAPLAVQAQTTTACGPEIKNEVAAVIAQAAKLPLEEQQQIEASIYDKYIDCAKADAANFPTTNGFYYAARQCGSKVSYIGSLFYEEMPCCGYDPQRRTFACPVKIKQGFGFGGAPLPGSREYVLHCVADAAGVFRPVGDDSVHLADSRARPTWQFAVVANAVNRLDLVQPMDGATRTARSILSWNLRPTSCDYRPIWGNVINYRIRLDQ